MKIVIQCAGSKNEGGFWQTGSGERVTFVGDPQKAPLATTGFCVRPDDIAKSGKSWRELLLDYNRQPETYPFKLHPAYRLYKNRVYRDLVAHFGMANVYILSAGWGLIEAGFLTPQYDITFQGQAAPHARRGKNDACKDFCMLSLYAEDTVVYLGGKDYLSLFSKLISQLPGRKIILHNQINTPAYQGHETLRYQTSAKTNWHYACANDLISGSLVIDV